MLALWRSRNFSLLWFAGTVSLFGDWMLFVALPFFVYQLSHSALITGTMFIVQAVPRIIFGSLAGVFVDRWNRKWTMVVADLLRVGLLLLLLLIHSAHDVWLVYLVAAVETTLAQFFQPAKNAAIPLLVGPEQLVQGNALNSVSENLARVVGTALGGVLLAQLGISSSAILDSLSFLISGLLIACISMPAGATPTAARIEAKPGLAGSTRKLLKEWKEGLIIAHKDRLVSGIFLIISIVMLAEGIITVLLVPFVTVALHGNATDLGWLMSGLGIGGLLGSLVVSTIGKRYSKLHLIAWTILFGGLLRLLIVCFPILPIDIGLIIIAGVIAILCYVYVSVVLQSAVPNVYLGRVFGIYGTLQGLAMLGGMLIASLLGDRVGVVLLMAAATTLYASAGLLALFFLVREMDKDQTSQHVPSLTSWFGSLSE